MANRTFFAPGQDVEFAVPGESYARVVHKADGRILTGDGTAAPTGGQTNPQTFTPAITSSSGTAFALGTTGETEGRYLQVGKLVLATGRIKLGSAGSGLNVGANRYQFSLPVTPQDPTYIKEIGVGRIYDDSAGDTWTATVVVTTDAVAEMRVTTTTAGDELVGAAKPVVPAESDIYTYSVVYEAA
jgi:hypothetical protein